jgi:hypothetical protein
MLPTTGHTPPPRAGYFALAFILFLLAAGVLAIDRPTRAR